MRGKRLIVLISILAGLFAPPMTLAQDAPPTADELFALATQVANRLEEVRDLAEQAAADVDHTFNLLGLVEAFSFVVTVVGGSAAIFGVTRFISAQQELQEARKRFDQEIDASRERLARETEQRQREFAELREHLERSTSDATLALSYLPLGEGQYKSGDFKGAIDIYQRALKLDPKNPIINYRLGYAYTQSGMLEEAERYLQNALITEPDFAPALASLGYVYRRRGEKMDEGIERVTVLNKAEYNLVRALTLSPKLVDADGESWWGSLGGLYRRRGQIDQAIYAYSQAAEVTPNSSYAFSNLALLYMQKNNRKAMIETYRQVEKLAADEVLAETNNYWAYTDLVTSRLALGKLADAEKALERLFVITPDDSPYVLEVLRETLTRLADALPPSEAEGVRAVCQRIGDQITLKAQQRAAAAARQAAADAHHSEADDSSVGD
jgi:tetratricopeptide (TPR) repeat protein